MIYYLVIEEREGSMKKSLMIFCSMTMIFLTGCSMEDLEQGEVTEKIEGFVSDVTDKIDFDDIGEKIGTFGENFEENFQDGIVKASKDVKIVLDTMGNFLEDIDENIFE